MKKLIIVILSCLLLVACNEKVPKQDTPDTSVTLKNVIVIGKETEGIKALTYYIVFKDGLGSPTKFKLESSRDQYDFIEKDSKVNIIYDKKTYKLIDIDIPQ